MSKWKWIAQDYDGEIYKYRNESGPRCVVLAFFSDDGEKRLVEQGKQNPNFANTLINLETEDYEINDGILTRIPHKTELDKLIANIEKIDKKSAKWMNKNRHELNDCHRLKGAFCWAETKQGHKFWMDINEKLEEMAEQQPAKETLKYRVALCLSKNQPYIMISYDQPEEEQIEFDHTFVRWLTDWIEVEV
jgi:hypothetical protein